MMSPASWSFTAWARTVSASGAFGMIGPWSGGGVWARAISRTAAAKPVTDRLYSVRVRSGLRTAEFEGLAWSDHWGVGQLLDLQQRVDRRVPEQLLRLRDGPGDLDALDGRGLPEPDVLGV